MEFQQQIGFNFSTNSGYPIPVLFVARMLVVFLVWVRGLKHILPPFLPFFPGLDALREFPFLYFLLDWLYWISLAMVFSGIRFQSFSLILGLLLIFSILSSKPQFSNSFLYSGCCFVLIGLYRPGLEWIFKVQIALLYLGAGLNKLLDPDWQSGQFFDFFLSEVYSNSLYLSARKFFEELSLAKVLSWITILAEIGFGVWVLTKRRRVLLFLLIQVFHLSMLIFTKGQLSYIFYFLMAVSSYLILPWEEEKGSVITCSQGSGFWNRMKTLDWAPYFLWKQTPVFQKKSLFRGDFSRYKFFVYNYFAFSFLVCGITFFCMYKNKFLMLVASLW